MTATDHLGDAEIAAILRRTRRIALVGASARPDRASYGVMAFLLSRGWHVTPVNPALAGQDLLGRTVVATLDDAGPLDLVDVFRASDQAGGVVDEAIRLGARGVWLQLGVIDTAAAAAGAGGGTGRGDGPLPGDRGAAAGGARTRLISATAWAMS